MVDGNDRIKMSTSIIDYIFRELAITYLNKTELAQVTEEDLEPDAVRKDTVDTAEFQEEELVSERTLVLEPPSSASSSSQRTPAVLRPEVIHPVSPHVKGATNGQPAAPAAPAPLVAVVNGNGNGNGKPAVNGNGTGNGHGNGNGNGIGTKSAPVAPAVPA